MMKQASEHDYGTMLGLLTAVSIVVRISSWHAGISLYRKHDLDATQDSELAYRTKLGEDQYRD